jgi:hypothetical protein
MNMDPDELEGKITPYTGVSPCICAACRPGWRDHGRGAQARNPGGGGCGAVQRGSYKACRGGHRRRGLLLFPQYRSSLCVGGILLTDYPFVYRSRPHCSMTARRASGRGVGSCNYVLVISAENYRLSELSAALVLAQCGRTGSLSGTFRSVKKRIVEGNCTTSRAHPAGRARPTASALYVDLLLPNADLASASPPPCTPRTSAAAPCTTIPSRQVSSRMDFHDAAAWRPTARAVESPFTWASGRILARPVSTNAGLPRGGDPPAY